MDYPNYSLLSGLNRSANAEMPFNFVDVERLQFPGWAAPLILGMGCGIAGAFFASEHNFSLSSLLTGFLGGACAGALAGSFVWMADRFRDEPPVPDFAAQFRPPVAASRWHALVLVAIGIVGLAANHGLVAVGRAKNLEIVFFGAVVLLIGIGGCVHPSFILGARTATRGPSLTSSCIGGVFLIAGVALAVWLWALVYP
jgi:hypothetical protein